MKYEYATTHDEIRYDERGNYVESAPNPVPPDGDGWVLVATCVGHLRYSRMAVFWSWQREVA